MLQRSPMVSRRGMPNAETIGLGVDGMSVETVDPEKADDLRQGEDSRRPLREQSNKGNCIWRQGWLRCCCFKILWPSKNDIYWHYWQYLFWILFGFFSILGPNDAPWRCCRFISFLDVVVLCFAGAACVAGIVSCWEIHNFAALGLRGCSVGLCVLLCIEQVTRNTSCTCKCMRQLFPPLEYWVGRGLLHVFISIQMEGTNSEGMDKATRDITNVASMGVFAMGGFFIAGAFLCFGPLERRGQRLAVRKEEVMKELSELERKKKALESEAGI